MGLGFTWVLVVMSAIRELLGSGTIMGIRLVPDDFLIKFFANSPGGFFVFGLLIAITYLTQDQRKLRKARKAAALKEAALKEAAAIREAELKAAALKAEAEKQAAAAQAEPAAATAPVPATEGTEHGTV